MAITATVKWDKLSNKKNIERTSYMSQQPVVDGLIFFKTLTIPTGYSSTGTKDYYKETHFEQGIA